MAERDFLYGTSFLIKKAVIDKISFMDPYFFFSVEEYDYCTRAKRAGFKVMYVPQSKIWHKGGASSAKLPQFPETQSLLKKKGGAGEYKYYYRLFRTHCPPVLFVFPFFFCMVWLSLLGQLVRLLWRRDWQAIKRVVAKRMSPLLRVTSKSHFPH
jgi:GT2 family glycosyltransferase